MVQTVKVLGIGGSPRPGGNTDVLLDSVLAGAKDRGAATEKVILNSLNFRPCQECGLCDRTGECALTDGMSALYGKIDRADHIVIASPLFFRSVSAQLKMMIDRFHCRWIAANILKKGLPKKARKGIFICAASDAKDGACEDAKRLAKAFFRTIGADYAGEIICQGVEKMGDSKKRGDIMARAFDMGKTLAGIE